MHKNKIILSLLIILVTLSLIQVKALSDDKNLKELDTNYEINHTLTNLGACFTVYAKNQLKNRVSILRNKTSKELSLFMGKGWNLGNGLDSTINGKVGETLWSNPTINKSLLELVHNSGFDTVRIPISFMDKIGSKESGYNVDKKWLNRIKEVVDYAIELGMFVIIDIHHDGNPDIEGSWLDISIKDASKRKEMLCKFSSVWKQLATLFANYDQHLIFEGVNELIIKGNYEFAPSIAYENINLINQTFVDTIRSVDGNLDRCLIISGYNADINLTINDLFKKPKDKIDDRLILSIHYYDPFDFSLKNSCDVLKWGTDKEKKYMENNFKKILKFANNLNMPVIIGEYGAVDKNNLDSRILYLKTLNQYASKYNIATIYWDNGLSKRYEFGLFDRNTNTVLPDMEKLIIAIID